MVPTSKNRNSRRKYGLTILELEDLLLSITKDDLIKGPVKDIDVPGESVYIFKKKVRDNILFYIKIKRDDKLGYDRIKILSIHEDEG